MHAHVVLLLTWILTGWAAAETRPSSASTATAPAVAETLAAECLNHAARSLGHLHDNNVAERIGRIRALLRHAARLRPEGVRTNRQLVDLYEGFGDLKSAAGAAERYVRVRPRDYAVAVRWVHLAQATLDRADQRIALLTEIMGRNELLAETRAAAAAQLYAIYLRQGDDANAADACRRALEFDSHERTALETHERLGRKPGLIEAFRTTVGLFQSSPRSLDASWELAQRVQAAGLYDESLKFYEHAYALAKDKPLTNKVVGTLVIDYVNAMLDAARAEEALEFFKPLVKDHGHDLGLRALMVEACRALKKDEEAAAHVNFMVRVYEPLSAPAAKRTGPQMAELGWFNLHFRSKSQAGLQWARAASMSAGDDPFVRLVLGAAELKTGNVQEGVKILTPLAEERPFAAVVLARHYFSTNAPTKAQEVLLKAAGRPRTGPAWRELADVAAKHNVPLPPVPHRQDLKEATAAVPAHVFETGRFPERLVSVKLSAVEGKVAVGEPVAVTVELKNISQRRVALGPHGLFTPVVFLSLKLEGGASASLPNLTPVHLPAPKYLLPGESVSETARVDVGAAEWFLMATPLADLKLTVSALLDPLQRGKEMVSSAPGVKIAPVVIDRPALFATSGDATPARYALAYIARRDLEQGDLPVKLRAARQTAALLGHVRKVEQGKAKAVFPEVLTKPVLLSMARAFLRAPAPIVRAEMLAALRHVELDEATIALMGPNVEDESALVRMRLIELLAGQHTKGHETLLDVFSKDPDAGVREMSAAFGGGQ